MAKPLLPSLLLPVAALLGGCQAPGSSDGRGEWSSSADNHSRSPLISQLFKAYQENELELWREHVTPDAVASWNTTHMNGEEFVAALVSAHERFQGITVKNLRITTVARSATKVTSFVSLDWNAKVRSNGRQIEIPCQATIQWEGMKIVAWNEVFDTQIVMDALEADGGS